MEDRYLSILLDIQADVSSTKQAVADLAGPFGRVTRLENAQTRQWWYTTIVAIVAPFLAIAHAIARKYGVNV